MISNVIELMPEAREVYCREREKFCTPSIFSVFFAIFAFRYQISLIHIGASQHAAFTKNKKISANATNEAKHPHILLLFCFCFAFISFTYFTSRKKNYYTKISSSSLTSFLSSLAKLFLLSLLSPANHSNWQVLISIAKTFSTSRKMNSFID